MLYNGVNFYDDYWADKTEAEFIAHESHQGLTEKQLKEAWSLMHPKKKVNNPSVDTGAAPKKATQKEEE